MWSLKEFMETDIYKNSDVVEYIGVDGMSLKYVEEDDLLDFASVIDYKKSGGHLEIKLNVY